MNLMKKDRKESNVHHVQKLRVQITESLKDFLWKDNVIRFRFSLSGRNVNSKTKGQDKFQFSSVTQSCLTLGDSMNHSTPALLVHH